ncbi:sigma-70 family RNA polymerase sigma factor [Pseudomonas sp. S31]|uniref:sigma-70 family RNA polymerase sigma factor n=1 Tax=Pseudomonas sp. S31 TaxID=1564473 RepID=UPI002E2C5352|nr:sigma-70 family RNA polymerase sigma factor [Pseudomonas sp. S31]MBK5003199.1 sigma-70 family RNA polymerase sigma factor [Pseudomonas sp. S31]
MFSPPTSPSTQADIQALYSEHHAWLVDWLRKRLRQGDNAADLAQDTFVNVLGKPERLKEVQQPRAWLSTIARALVIDRARRDRVERAYLDAIAHLPEPLVPSPEAQMILLETLAKVDALLDGLPPKVRKAFLMSRLDGLGYKAIAVELGVSLRSVESYMAKAIRHCYFATS